MLIHCMPVTLIELHWGPRPRMFPLSRLSAALERRGLALVIP